MSVSSCFIKAKESGRGSASEDSGAYWVTVPITCFIAAVAERDLRSAEGLQAL